MAAYELCFVVLENCTYMFNKINCMSVEMLQSLYFSQSYTLTYILNHPLYGVLLCIKVSFVIWSPATHKE